ncbi:MAG: hypothetical protein KAJ66_03865 [Candidatus Omnitrophica bacterium]|nr:hypothetical protein [Candidatus Omnitrophota bacterium]
MLTVYLQFALFSGLIIFFGYKLSVYGRDISKQTFFSEALFGIIFLAVITSLPELIASISSAVMVDLPNMAASDVLGSILINLMIIGVLDFIQGKGGILSLSGRKHILTASITIGILAIISLSLLLREIAGVHLGFFNIGYESYLIIIIFIFSTRMLYQHGQEKNEEKSNGKKTIGRLWLKFGISAAIVVISGLKIAECGAAIVENTPLSDNFVGLVFLAVVTSLPELIVSITALRLGSVNMAIGNILGSNFFDTLIIPLTDICYRKDQILSVIDLSHLFTLILCILFSAIIISGISYRSKKSFLKLGWDVIFMFIIFIVAVYFFYIIGCR